MNIKSQHQMQGFHSWHTKTLKVKQLETPQIKQLAVANLF